MSTIGTLTERIMQVVNGGSATTNQRVGREAIKHQLTSALSALFKASVLDINFGYEGDSMPDGLLIATYEGIPVTRRDNGQCVAVLPAAPVVLPKGIGVFSMYPSGHPEQEYIPIRAGQINLLRADKLLSRLGPKTYTVSGNRVVVHSDIVGAGVLELDMQLCVLELSKYGDYDPLPVPADLEEAAITNVLKVFGLEAPLAKADNKAPSPQKSDL